MFKSDIDILDILTPPETHLEVALKAAGAGKHILCQKPFAPTIAEAEKIVEAAERAGVRLMVSENWRWLDPYQRIKGLLDQGKLGEIYRVKFSHMDYLTPLMTADCKYDQLYLRENSKLIFYDMGVHWCDVWRFLFGEPKRLYAELMRVSPEVRGEDSAFVILAHDSFQGMMDMSWATRMHMQKPVGETLGNEIEQLMIEGSRATLFMYSNLGIKIVDNVGDEQWLCQKQMMTNEVFEQSVCRLQSHFLEGLENGWEFQTSGHDNLRTLRLTYSVYESANEHKAIIWK